MNGVMIDQKPIYIFGCKQLKGDQNLKHPEEKTKYLVISKIVRHESDFGYFGKRDIVFFPEKITVGQTYFRHYTQEVNIDGDRAATQKGDVPIDISQAEHGILTEIIKGFKDLSDHVTEFSYIEDGYENFEHFFIFLKNHFNIDL